MSLNVLVLPFQLLNKAVPVVRTEGLAFWEVSVPVRSTSPAVAVNMTRESGKEMWRHNPSVVRRVHTRCLNELVCFVGTVGWFRMENGFRKDVRTVGVDMDFCTASHISSATTAVSSLFIRFLWGNQQTSFTPQFLLIPWCQTHNEWWFGDSQQKEMFSPQCP